MDINVNGKKFKVVGKGISSHMKHWKYVNAGTWEPNTFKIFDEFIDKDHNYIDMGAWIGSTVLYGCQLARHTYAIEPDPIALTALKNNINKNSKLQKKITIFEGGISKLNGTMFLGNPNGDSESTFISGNNAVAVSTVTFDRFISMYNITDCNFIKMDIEGSEKNVLPLMASYVIEHKPVLYISFHPWFLNTEDKECIKQSLSCYNYFYSVNDKRKLNLNEILSVREILVY